MSNEENTTKHRDAASKPVEHETNHQCPRRRYAVTSSYQLSLVATYPRPRAFMLR
jgi:hypothetical protein